MGWVAPKPQKRPSPMVPEKRGRSEATHDAVTIFTQNDHIVEIELRFGNIHITTHGSRHFTLGPPEKAAPVTVGDPVRIIVQVLK